MQKKQHFDNFNCNSVFQLFNGISSDLQNLFKLFNGTAIVSFLKISLFPSTSVYSHIHERFKVIIINNINIKMSCFTFRIKP